MVLAWTLTVTVRAFIGLVTKILDRQDEHNTRHYTILKEIREHYLGKQPKSESEQPK